jgi:acyl carrier protein
MKIFSSGLLDSLMFIELVLFVEKEFQIKLAKTKAVNMNSIDTVGQIIEAVLSAAGQSR